VKFLLDAQLVIDFQASNALHALAKAAETVELAVVEQVFHEVTLPRAGDKSDTADKKMFAGRALAGSRLEIVELNPGTAPEPTLKALLAARLGSSKKDTGEAASIAIAKHDPSLVFVTGDKTATLWALNELFHTGERVMRVPVFVRTLHERGALAASVVRAVAERAASHGAVPTWWSSWLGGLSSS
jgi:hypothetical protein